MEIIEEGDENSVVSEFRFVLNSQIFVSPPPSTSVVEEEYNEIHCVNTWKNDRYMLDSFVSQGYSILASKRLVHRQMGLYIMLFVCQYIGFISFISLILQWICNHEYECHVFVIPGVCILLLVGILKCILTITQSNFFKSQLFQVENGIVFVVTKEEKSAIFSLDTNRSAKEYDPDIRYPFTVLQCARSCATEHGAMKMVFFTLPQNKEWHIPVTCDAIDILRSPPTEWMSGSKKTPPPHHHAGILVIKIVHTKQCNHNEPFLVFLFKSGFSILCHTKQQETTTIVAMKTVIEPSSPWSNSEVTIQLDGAIAFRLYFYNKVTCP